jgi:hypothetical protein
MGMTFTEQEIERKTQLRDLIAANPTSPEVSAWQAELREIVSAAHARMLQRADKKRAKDEEKESEIEVVKIEDFLLSDEHTELDDNRARSREIQSRLDAAPRKKKRVQLEAERDELLDADLEMWRKAERRVIQAGKCLPMPERDEWQDDEDFNREMEEYRLNLAEAGCYRKLNSAKTSFNLRRDVEKELQRIEERRRQLRPEDYKTESSAPTSTAPDLDDSHEEITKSKYAPSIDCSDLSDVALREALLKQQFLRDRIGVTDNGPLIAAHETEIRRRGMQF